MAPDAEGAAKSPHHGRRLPEKYLAFLIGADAALVRVDFVRDRIGARGCRTGTDRFEPALEVGQVVERLALPLMRQPLTRPDSRPRARPSSLRRAPPPA